MGRMQDKNQDDRTIRPSIIASLFFAVLGLWILSWFLAIYFINDWTQRASFGDMFGAVNALFSGFAFAGLIYTIYLQSKELGLQREELKQTREELKGQKQQLEKQNITFEHQNFENTFFQLLRFHTEIVNSIDISEENLSVVFRKGLDVSSQKETTKGRDCFTVFYDRFRGVYNKKTEIEDERKRIEEAYKEFFVPVQSDLGHYFRNLYHIIKFVDQGSNTDKKFYTNLVRAQLSSYEHIMLFYNCLGPYGKNKFKPLVEKYELLENMPRSELIKEAHKQLYSEKAFGKPDYL